MELIGKKVTRKTAFETSNEPKLTVEFTEKVGRLGLTSVAMRKINLYDKEIGIAYDDDKAFMYITEEGGNKVKDNGSINSKYHAKRIMSMFNITGPKCEFDISTEAQNFSEQGDINFYEITLKDALLVEVDSENTEESFPGSNVVDQDSLEETMSIQDMNIQEEVAEIVTEEKANNQ